LITRIKNSLLAVDWCKNKIFHTGDNYFMRQGAIQVRHNIYKIMWTPLQISGFSYCSHARCWQVYKTEHTAMQSP
jgi:hypothetical protein